jgi:peroxiredoxin
MPAKAGIRALLLFLDSGLRRNDGSMAADGDLLRAGPRLPAIALPATSGGEICLAALPGLSVVAVYPWTGRPGHPNPPDWDNIPGAHGSTPELEGFRDLFPAFVARDVGLFGLSKQSSEHQSELAARLKLPFPILSDLEARFTDSLSLPVFATGGATYLTRLTLLIRDGTIGHVFYPVSDPAAHAREVLAWLTAREEAR